jgi:uncharacterized damage-inducible protein DinB
LEDLTIKIDQLVEKLDNQVYKSINHLKTIDPSTLTEARTVGRKKLPTTLLGLLFHAAEHTMRHTGQMLVTARILYGDSEEEED